MCLYVYSSFVPALLGLQGVFCPLLLNAFHCAPGEAGLLCLPDCTASLRLYYICMNCFCRSEDCIHFSVPPTHATAYIHNVAI